MKTLKLKKWLCGFILTASLSPWTVTHAAQEIHLFGNINHNANFLKKFSLNQTLRTDQTLTLQKNIRLAQDLSDHRDTMNTLQLAGGYVDRHRQSHVRYDQYYRDIPVWGMQIIYSGSTQENTILSGSLIDGIEQDIPDVDTAISVEKITRIVFGNNAVPSNMNIEKIIYFDENNTNKAILAYHISYINHAQDEIAIVSYIYDANDGTKLTEWNDLPTGYIKTLPK